MKTPPKPRSRPKASERPKRGPAAPARPDGEPARVGRRGAVVIPAALRRLYGFEEGSTLLAEARPEGVLLRPATVVPVEAYTPERIAEFLLSNAVDADDYARAVARVRAMNLDPAAIPHHKPRGA